MRGSFWIGMLLFGFLALPYTACFTGTPKEKTTETTPEKTPADGASESVLESALDTTPDATHEVLPESPTPDTQDSPPSDTDTGLRWYFTCGDPACSGHRHNHGVSDCTTQKAGDPCSTDGDRCDPIDSCNRLLLCSKTDPTKQPGGCPISTRRLKRDIRYLGPKDKAAIHQEMIGLRLASYQYTFEAKNDRGHIGFLLEDQPDSRIVDARRNVVSLYNYASMTVAAMQTQAAQIQALQALVAQQTRQIQELQTSLRDLSLVCKPHPSGEISRPR